jgi:transcriptional antiterminator RfaH
MVQWKRREHVPADTDKSRMAWFLIHTNPRQEERTTTNLRAWNVETFSPLIRERRSNQFSGEVVYVTKPLFGRYVFARFQLSRLFHKVRYTRGVSQLVSFGGDPVEVDNEIIELIRSRIGEDGFVQIGCDLQPGDPVAIREGALKDFTGVFEREMRGSDRVVLLLDAVSYQARVQIERSLLRKVSA